ncbi:MAG: hypothetical protein AAFQ82_10815 [Myxococcota bacterium]
MWFALLLTTMGASPTAIGAVMVDGEQLFTIEHFEQDLGDGVVQIRRRTLDQKGAVAYTVHAKLKNGLQQDMQTDHPQRKLKGRVRFDNGVVRYELTKADGSVERDTDRVDGPVMSAPGLVSFMQRDAVWRDLLAGETVELTYVSWSRQSTYGFRLKKSSRSTDRKTVVVMQPSSWIIRQVFPDIFYTFRTEDRRLTRYQGQISVKKVEPDGDLSDVVADVRFRYPRG